MTTSQSPSEQEAALMVAGFTTLVTGHVCKIVCINFGISREEILGRRRLKRISHPRQIAMTLAREFTGRSYPALGRYFGGRDHTTVLHARSRVYRLADADPAFAAELGRLRKALTAYAAQIAGEAA